MPTQFETLLTEGMQRRAVGVRVRPGIAHRAYRAYRWRRGTMRAAAVTVPAAAAAAAILVSGVTAPRADEPTASRTGRATMPKALTMGYILSRMGKALGSAQGSNLVEYERTNNIEPGGTPAGLDENWSYKNRWSSIDFSPGGQLQSQSWDMQARGRITSVYVNFTSQTWSRNVNSAYSPPVTCRTISPVASGQGDYRAAFERALHCGTYLLAGHRRINGQVALKIVRSVAGPQPGLVIWVNQATYLPIQLTILLDGGKWAQTTNISWLPPTAANLAKLNRPPRIPAGFRRTQPLG